MCNSQLIALILKFCNQEMEAFVEIYNVFTNLINFYSKKLRLDDAVQEFNLFFIELIYKIDLNSFESDCTSSLQKYIAVCIRNKYISLSKEKQKCAVASNELCDYMGGFECNNDDRITLEDGMKFLSLKQRKVITYRYIYDYSDAEIADMLLISRQAVNKIRKKGLEVLKSYYFGNLK